MKKIGIGFDGNITAFLGIFIIPADENTSGGGEERPLDLEAHQELEI